MVEEALEFLLHFRDVKDLNYQRSVLQCLLKILLLIKKELLTRYPLVMRKIVDMVKHLASNYY